MNNEEMAAYIPRREFSNIQAMSGLILQAIGYPTKRHRDFVCAVQSAGGGTCEPFERGHLALARFMQHKGGEDSATTFVRREIEVVERFMRRTGIKIFEIQRGGGPEHKRTTYTDYLTPIAAMFVQRARSSELWRGNPAKGIKPHPGKAMEAQVAEAVEMLPRVQGEQCKESEPEPPPLGVRIARNRRHAITRACAIFSLLAENGGDVVEFARGLTDEIESRALLIASKGRSDSPDEGLQNCHPSSEAGRVTNLSPSEVVETPENLSNQEAALIYAGRGWPVFPCEARGKKPLISEWQKRATTDADQINKWFQKWPDANVGIPTGAASGIVVIDTDADKGGDDNFRTLIEQHGDLPETSVVATGGGGLHFLFAHPGIPIKNSVSSLDVGIDVRGDGGYIIAPPSVHESGRVYQWLKASTRAPLPEWLLALLTEEKKPSEAKSAAGRVTNLSLSGSTPIVEGQRNEMLFKRACSLRGRGAEQAEIEAHLLEINASEVSPPLPASEIQKIARSAASYAPNRVAVGA